MRRFGSDCLNTILHRLCIVGRREQYDRCLITGRAQLLEHVDAADCGHVLVDDQHVRLVDADGSQRFVRVDASRRHGKVSGKQEVKSDERDRVIVHNDDPSSGGRTTPGGAI